MELDVSKAFATPATPFPFEATVVLPPQEMGGQQVEFDPVELKGVYAAYEGVIRLEGSLQTVAHSPCALCMQSASQAVELTFSETFRKDADEQVEESFRYQGKSVPLDHMTLTLVLLELPMRFQCEGGCKGGAGLQAWRNDSPVNSQGATASQRRPFEALRSLLDEEPER